MDCYVYYIELNKQNLKAWSLPIICNASLHCITADITYKVSSWLYVENMELVQWTNNYYLTEIKSILWFNFF